jgi:hypothetical protein
MLLQRTSAFSAHHGSRTVLLRTKASSVLPCSGSISEHVLARKSALDTPPRDLHGGVCYAAATQRPEEKARSAMLFVEGKNCEIAVLHVVVRTF